MAEPAPSLTIVIPSYERRDALRALLDGLTDELRDAPGVDVLVVLDGSEDGSAEMLAELDYPVALSVVAQANAGLAAARNRGLDEAAGEIVWFLDDDMLPAPGLVARHRAAHAPGARRMLMGPCLPPAGAPIVALVREWAEQQYGELARVGSVVRAEYFSAANTSAPSEVWRGAGGFDASFVGWGGEDYELAVRLLAAGVPIDYDATAVAWHHQERGIAAFCATKRAEGRNTVRIGRLHPAVLDDLLPVALPGARRRLLRRIARDDPRRYGVLARALAAAASGEARLTRGRSRRLLAAAAEASFLAGLAEADPGGSYLDRRLGRSARASRTDSSPPSRRPTGSQ